jgi:hypothetical protein
VRFWANLLGYQAVWFGTVIAASRGMPWIGVALAVAFVLLQWSLSHERRSDLRLVACALLIGLVLDGSIAASGLLRYTASTPPLAAPAWILALWAAFALTLNHSLAFLRGRVDWAIVLGALGGPLAYAGAARGFHALEFEAPAWRGAMALALGWSITMPMLAVLAQRWHRRPRVVGLQGATR